MNWEALSPYMRSIALAHVKVYINDLIDIVQVGPEERRHMTRHLFHDINKFFRSNAKDNTACKDPILLKKLRKGGAAWSTHKVILIWAINTVQKILILP